jgi:hypothetical protein
LQIKVAPGQRGYLAPSQAREGGEQHQGAEPAVLLAVGPALIGQLPQCPLGNGMRPSEFSRI